ncbi:MAG: lipid-A-disaccharide synthase [Prevotella sp.]|nr:lipid-A-disaccharide synthase [Prevotella sp.]
MKYYLIVGEASGDLHASHLMRSLQQEDPEAQFRFFGGDLMSAVGGIRVRHYKELAYMGFIPVLMHLPTIFRNLKFCKQDITQWRPDAVILVDYPGFNLKIAKYLHKERIKAQKASSLQGRAGVGFPQIYYYISPKIWAWKEWRIRNIKRDIDQLFSILPFEVDFFEHKHHYPIHYVGNPTAHEVREFRKKAYSSLLTGEGSFSAVAMKAAEPSGGGAPLIALLAGSRKQEIKDNLPAMIEAATPYASDYQLVVAGAPSIDEEYYAPFIEGKPVTLVMNKTYELLSQATAALVTSGTATLETALFEVPQAVCYKTPVPRLIRFAFNHIIKCRYISLVNLIADREVVPELLADRFSVENIRNELRRLLPGHDARTAMLFDYRIVQKKLGGDIAPDNAARLMVHYLRCPKG